MYLKSASFEWLPRIRPGERRTNVAGNGEAGGLPDGLSFFHVRFQKLAPGANPVERRLKSRAYLHRVGTDPGKQGFQNLWEISA